MHVHVLVDIIPILHITDYHNESAPPHHALSPYPLKENIPDAVISKIQPYIDNEDFTPQAISKVSKACTSICQWVRAMHKYYFVSKAVAPKRVSTVTLYMQVVVEANNY